MDGNTSENTQVPTYVRTLAEDFQKLNSTVAQNTQEIGILRQSLQGEVGSLSTNDASLQTLIESHGTSLTQEQLVRAKLVQGVVDEVADLRSQHSKDHAQVIGLIEEHHGSTSQEFATQSASLDVERSERIAGDEALVAKLNETDQQNSWYFNATMAAVGDHTQALDDTTWDSTEWTFDNDDYTIGWSILSAAQQWELELGSYIAEAEKAINTKLRTLESVVIQAAQDSSQALENTDVSTLVGSLLGQVGVDALDAELWGRFTEVEDGIERERRERAEQVRLEATYHSQRLLEETQKLSEQLLAESAERTDAFAEVAHRTAQLLELEAQDRVALIEEEAQRLLTAINGVALTASEALEAKTNELSVAYDKKVTDVRDELRLQFQQLQDGVTIDIEELRTSDANIITSLNAFKVSTGDNFAVVSNQVQVVTNAHASTASTVEGLSVSFAELHDVADKLTADVATLTEVVADGDSALAERIDTVSTGLGETTAKVNTVSTALSELDSATATRFEEVGTDLDGLGTAVANAQSVADSAVTANTAQANELNSVKATLANKADALAVSNLEAVVNSNEQAMSSRLDSLAASITDIGEGAETNVDVNAFNALKAEVTNTRGVVTGHTTDLNNLKGSMTNAQAGLDANNEAISGLDTKVTQHGQDIQSQATDIASVKAGLTQTNDKVNTKADATALNTTNTNVANIDGRTTANTDSLNTLSGRVTATENGLSKKADSSALQNIYTKTESDAKSTEIASGELSKYKASLKLGGDNLLINSNFTNGMTGWSSWENSTASSRTIITKFRRQFLHLKGLNTAYFKGVLTSIGLDVARGESLTLSFLAYSDVVGQVASVLIHQTAVADGNDPQKYFATPVLTHEPKRYSFTWQVPTDKDKTSFTFMFGGAYGTLYDICFTEVMVQVGNVATGWVPSNVGILKDVTANAQAISTTNAKVTEVDGVVKTQVQRLDQMFAELEEIDTLAGTALKNAATAQTTANTAVTKADANASQITGLASRMATAEGNINKKADASILAAYYTSAKADEVIAGELSEFKSSLVIGGNNLVTNSFKNFRVGSVGQPTQVVTSILSDGSVQIKPTNTPLESTYFTNWWGSTTGFGPVFQEIKDSEDITISLWFRAVDPTNLPRFLPSFYLTSGMSYVQLQGDISALANGKEVAFTQTRKWFPGTTSILPHLSIAAGSVGGGLILSKWKIERGSIATGWSESNEEVQARTVATATALADRYTKVDADSAIAVAANSLKAQLDNTLATYDQTIDTWVERNKVEAAMVESLAAELVPHMAGNTELFADIEINAGYQGVVTALADANATTAMRVDQFEAKYGGALATIETTELAIADLEKSVTQQLTVLESSFSEVVEGTLQPAVDDLTGKLNQTNAKLTNDYITKTDATKAIANATTTLKSEVTTSLSNIRLDSVSIPDTRNDNQNPQWYWTHYSYREVTEFKYVNTVGLTSALIGNTYGVLTTTVQWNDSSGGPIRQVMRGGAENQVYVRKSATLETWGPWTALGASLAVKITEQSEVVDGIRGMKTVTIDNNGVLSGYGLVSDLVAGKVTSAFGVNADQFYVGSPSTGKKVFSVVNGQTVINDAIVGNLSANKITTGTMHGDRITAGTIKADHLSAAAIDAVSVKARNFSLTAADGSKQVQNGMLTTFYHPNGRVAIRIGTW